MQGQIRITEQGEIISSKYSNPEVGRRNLETLASATLEATLLQDESPGARPCVSRNDGGTVALRLQGLSRPRLRDRRVRALFLGLDRDHRDRRPQHRLASRLAQEDPGDRGPARDSVGVLLGAVPADAARLVRLRLRGEGLYRGSPEGRARNAQGHVRALAVLPDPALQHGHGDGEVEPRHRLALRAPGRGRGAAREDLRPHLARMARFGRRPERDHGAVEASREQSAARPLDPQPLSLSRSAQPRAGRACSSSTARAPRAKRC